MQIVEAGCTTEHPTSHYYLRLASIILPPIGLFAATTGVRIPIVPSSQASHLAGTSFIIHHSSLFFFSSLYDRSIRPTPAAKRTSISRTWVSFDSQMNRTRLKISTARMAIPR